MTWLQILSSQTWTIPEISSLSIEILYLFMITQKKNLLLEQLFHRSVVEHSSLLSKTRPRSGICNQPYSKRNHTVKSAEVPNSEPKNQQKIFLLVKHNLMLLFWFSSCHFRCLLLSLMLKSRRKYQVLIFFSLVLNMALFCFTILKTSSTTDSLF